MKVKAVIFDLDGTLVNSIEGIAFSMNNLLKRHGLEACDCETYKNLVGNGMKELVRRLIPNIELDEKLWIQYFNEAKSEYEKNWHYKMYVYEGIEELLEYLVSKNIKIAINTNKDEYVSKLIAAKFFTKFEFSSIIGNNAMVNRKPDPEGARLIAKNLDVLPEQCIYIGDSEVDIMTAKNANMIQVSALWGFRKADDLISAGAQCLIKKPIELIEIVMKDISKVSYKP